MPSDDRRIERETAQKAYEMLMHARSQDNELQWTRSSLLLAVQAGLLALLSFSADASGTDNGLLAVVIAAAGLGAAITWAKLTEGGSYWIEFYQNRLRELEDDAFGDVLIFRSHPNWETDKSLGTHHQSRYVSTRLWLLYLTRGAVVTWLIILIWVFWALYSF